MAIVFTIQPGRDAGFFKKTEAQQSRSHPSETQQVAVRDARRRPGPPQGPSAGLHARNHAPLCLLRPPPRLCRLAAHPCMRNPPKIGGPQDPASRPSAAACVASRRLAASEDSARGAASEACLPSVSSPAPPAPRSSPSPRRGVRAAASLEAGLLRFALAGARIARSVSVSISVLLCPRRAEC